MRALSARSAADTIVDDARRCANVARAWFGCSTDRLLPLIPDVPAGPWHVRRDTDDGALVLWDAEEPLAHIYGGIDLAHYLQRCAPATLFSPALEDTP